MQMVWDGAAVVAVAELIPLPASWHFRLAVGASLALLTAGLGIAHGGYGELAGAGRHQIERAVGHFLLALFMLRLVVAMLDRGALISGLWMVVDAISTSVLLAGIRLARAPSGRAGPGGTVVIVAGEVDESGVEAAMAARGIAGGIAGAFCLNGAGHAGTHWPVIHPAHLPAILRGGGIRHVVFAGRNEAQAAGDEIFGDLFREVFGVAARVWLALDVHAVFPGAMYQRADRYRLVPMLGDHTLDARQPIKRFFDVLLGSVALICALPVMALIALALRLAGTREVLFRQERVGAGGRRFVLLKFRTMRTGAAAPFVQARQDDPRVTGIGRWLRRSSLDELPQLINVIRGDMSLVGPRPHAPETTVAGLNFEEAAKFYRLRYRVKPGMTGLAQIRGQRGATGDLRALEQRVTSDLEYIQSWSAWLDVMILARTIPAMLRPRNAY
jgi:exopolysaccharide biosynthesis polyprenyl glycosylphosphotransferase